MSYPLYTQIPSLDELMEGAHFRLRPTADEAAAFVDYGVGAMTSVPPEVQPFIECEWEFGGTCLTMNGEDVDLSVHGPLVDGPWGALGGDTYARPGPPWSYVQAPVFEIHRRTIAEIQRIYDVGASAGLGILVGRLVVGEDRIRDVEGETLGGRIPEPAWISHKNVPAEFYDDIMATGKWTCPLNQYGRVVSRRAKRADAWQYVGARHPGIDGGAVGDEEFAYWISKRWQKILGLPEVSRGRRLRRGRE